MARGRITDASIAAVRETTQIDRIIGDYVALKKAGPGTLKGLCPFHDEKSPSFHVTPARSMWHCFGCSEGGDVIKFVQNIENLGFIDTIENLAGRLGITLTYEPGRPGAPDHTETRAQRSRLTAANAAAAAFYADQLLTPDAQPARAFLTARGFDKDAATAFGCGYSPSGWDTLTKHLTSLGYTADELTAAGLTSEGRNGPIDRFRGRLMFPIHDITGDVIGFGARKLLPDDQDKGPKYLNTSETAIYKKSRVLYGLNKARKEISTRRRVVVVEGYTDVMACHLAGETTAVATCGTAFGEDHIRILRRLLGDDGTGGEVIYTFDGDSAGQKAALRAFTMDDHFQSRTMVAVAEDGNDPCEVRIAAGAEGVRALLDSRIPLFEFAIKSTLSQFDLNSLEGRSNAVTAIVPILANIAHAEMREGYVRQVSRWTGSSPEDLNGRLRRTASTNTHPGAPSDHTTPSASEPHPATAPLASAADTNNTATPPSPYPHPAPEEHRIARTVLKTVLQHQRTMHLAVSELRRTDFAHPTYRAVWEAAVAANDNPNAAKDEAGWVRSVAAHASDPVVAALVTELAVEPNTHRGEITHDYSLSTFLSLVIEACDMRSEWIQRAIADPTLPTERVTELLTTLTSTGARRGDAAERHQQILSAATPEPTPELFTRR